MIRRKPLIAVVLVGGALAFGIGALWHSQTAPTPFDRTNWLQGALAKSSSDAPRLRMADGLVGSKVLLGMSHAEIEAMLGPPTETNTFRAYGLVYWLGPERGLMSIDNEWLAFRFDKDNKSIEAEVLRD